MRVARSQERASSVDVGGSASEEVSQLLDQDRQARWLAAYDGGVGSVAERPLRFQHGQQVAQSTQPGQEQKLRGVYRARPRGRDRRRHSRDCRYADAPEVTFELWPQIQMGHVG